MSCPDLQMQFVGTFEKELNSTERLVTATDRWEYLCTIIHRVTMATFEKKVAKTNDWYEAV